MGIDYSESEGEIDSSKKTSQKKMIDYLLLRNFVQTYINVSLGRNFESKNLNVFSIKI